MKTRYKIGELSSGPVSVLPGDTINLILTEEDAFGVARNKQKITEEITIAMAVTHWVMFYHPGVGFGGMFGTSDIGSKMAEVFVEPELVDEGELLFGEGS